VSKASGASKALDRDNIIVAREKEDELTPIGLRLIALIIKGGE
jgi:hypothetical protein